MSVKKLLYKNNSYKFICSNIEKNEDYQIKHILFGIQSWKGRDGILTCRENDAIELYTN